MKLMKLRLRGAKGIWNGMGRYEVDLDLQDVNGLIALIGENGAGKSTLLEFMTPYRKLATRSGALTNHFRLKDSYREQIFEMDGHIIRTLLKINAVSGRNEAFLYMDEEPLTKGGNTEFDSKIVEIFGPEDLFYKSLFSAQKGETLADLTPANAKKLYIAFLDLEQYLAHEATCKEAIKVWEKALEAAGADLATIREEYEQAVNIGEKAMAKLDELEQEEVWQKNRIRMRDEAREKRDTLEKARQKSATDEERLGSIKAAHAAILETIENLTEASRDTCKRVAGQFDEAGDALQAAKKEFEQAEQADTYRSDIEKIEGLITESRSKISTVDEKTGELRTELGSIQDEQIALSHELRDLMHPAGEETSLSEQIDTLTEAVNALAVPSEQEQADTQLIEKLVRQTEQLKAELETAKTTESHDVSNARLRLEMAQAQAESLKDLDPDCTSIICGAAVAARKVKAEIPILDEAVTKAVQAAAENTAALLARFDEGTELVATGRANLEKQVDARLEKKAHLQKELDEATAERTTLESNRARYREHTETSIHELETRAATFRTKIGELERERNDLLENCAKLEEAKSRTAEWIAALPSPETARAAVDSISRQMDTYCEELDRILANRDMAMAEPKAKRQELAMERQKLAASIQSIDPIDIRILENSMAKYEEEIETGRDSIARMKAELSALEEHPHPQEFEEALEAAEKREAACRQEIAEWTWLRDAMGKNGIPALEIDGVAPSITAVANDLLANSFGTTMTLRIQTQNPETGKEDFKIMVIREDGETALEDMSGGQGVILMKAMQLAFASINKEKSGRDYRTAYSDEEDGALDVTRLEPYVALIRRFLGMGGMERLFFISHKPAVYEQADHFIRVTAGTPEAPGHVVVE